MKFWRLLGRKQQNQVLILVTALALGGYLVLWHLGNYRELAKTENLVSRERNRLENATGEGKVPAPAAGLASQLESARRELADLRQRAGSRRGFFVPLDNSQEMQELRLSISSLAESRGVYIQSVEEVGQPRAEDVNAVLEPASLELNLDNPYKRPLLRYIATGNFFNLQRFLVDLDQLKYNVSPVRLSLGAILAEDIEAEAVVQAQYLDVEMVLSL
ncbi:MAG: hypothetical protein P8101_04955 [Candidatus Thiodiazotropha sp.]|jgi:hypothetical protein